MNPPYSRTLHLKFLEKVIEITDTTVNISPGGFLNDIGLYNTYKDKTKNIIPHLYECEFIEHRAGNDLFGTGNGIMSNLHIGIYKHDYTKGKAYIDEDINNIYKKIRYTFKKNLRNNFKPKDKLSTNGVRIFSYHYDPLSNYYTNILCFTGNARYGIDFNSKEEKENFINSIKTWPYEFMNKVKDTNPAHLPWLEDYTRSYSDEDMYNIFNITDDEKKFIKRFLKNEL